MEFNNLMEYQKMIRKNLRTEQNTDRKIDLLSIINQLTSGPKNIVQVEQIILEANSRGFTADETRAIIDNLIEENIIFESSPGLIKKK